MKPVNTVVNYLETGSLSPFYNLAFEEYVLAHRTKGDYLMLWQNDNTIVIGQNQNAEAEINRSFVEEHHINVVRRSTGGGAVYHDLGNLNYSFITDVGDAEQLSKNFRYGPTCDEGPHPASRYAAFQCQSRYGCGRFKCRSHQVRIEECKVSTEPNRKH